MENSAEALRHEPQFHCVSPKVQQFPERLRIGVPAVCEFFGNLAYESAFQQAQSVAADMQTEMTGFDLKPFNEVAKLLYEGPWVAERYTIIEAVAGSNTAGCRSGGKSRG